MADAKRRDRTSSITTRRETTSSATRKHRIAVLAMPQVIPFELFNVTIEEETRWRAVIKSANVTLE